MELKNTWKLKEDDFLKKSINEDHPRTRERWLALYWIFCGISQQEIAKKLGRSRPTIQRWRERFEKFGPKAMKYKRSGGKEATLSNKEQKLLVEIVAKKSPRDVGINQSRWTCQLAAVYCKEHFGKEVSDETCRISLRKHGLTVKRPKKN